jgi:pimeloyl-ACP methyl ester carboxylesterase
MQFSRVGAISMKYVISPAVLVLVVIIACLLLYRGHMQGRVLRETGITSPDGIESLEKIRLGGVEQWILIRGQDKSNPVLLDLHGGPGAAEIAFARFFHTRLENHFTVVHWDQRGAGKSFSPDIAQESMTMEQFISDTRELVETLRERFSVSKVYVAGHSWGSLLGILTVSRYPELFCAYVGTGQLVDASENDAISYQFTLDKARESGNKKAIRQLEEIGPPPYDYKRLIIQRKWLDRFGGVYQSPNASKGSLLKLALTSPDYSLMDFFRYFRGTLFSLKYMLPHLYEINLFEEVPIIDVPVYFLVGKHDSNTPVQLTERYYQKLNASHGKQLMWFEKSGHMVTFDEPEKYCDFLIDKVLKKKREYGD